MRLELLAQLPIALRSELEKEWRRLEAENKLLSEQLRLLRLKKYGAKSDTLSDAQLVLLEGEPGVTPEEVQSEATRSPQEKSLDEELARRESRKQEHPGRNAFPANLPRVEEIIPCTGDQCQCAQCGEEKKVIGFEESEELAMKPIEYFVRVIKREKRACRHCEEMGVSTAPVPAKIIEKSKASNELIVDVILKKYCDHQPLYRQAASLEREAGIELSRATLCGWVMQTGGFMEALAGAMRKELLEGGYIQADETPIGVQSERTRGRNHQGYVWEYSRPGGAVVFDFQMGRGRDGPREFLGNFSGILQCDGYSAYAKIGGVGLRFAGCWAHVRRGFTDALKLAPGETAAQGIILEIAKLYGVEKEARAEALPPEKRLELRQQKSIPLLETIKEKILALKRRVLPRSAFAKACDYALGQWPRLTVYTEHGEVEIDNNWCENAIRPLALGRKNWLHIGSEAAGPRIAAIISVIETCRRLEINPREYLLDVLPKLPTWPASRVGELTPAKWLAAKTAASSQTL